MGRRSVGGGGAEARLGIVGSTAAVRSNETHDGLSTLSLDELVVDEESGLEGWQGEKR